MGLRDKKGQLTCKRADPRLGGKRVATHNLCLCMDFQEDCSPESAAPGLLPDPSWCHSQPAIAEVDDPTLEGHQGRLAEKAKAR